MLLSASLLFVFSLSTFVSALPEPLKPRGFGELPVVKLDYVTQKATSYDAIHDIYTFKNIRFAAPPVGPLRFAPPQPPAKESTVQDGSEGGTCMQSLPQAMLAGVVGPLAPAVGTLTGAIDLGLIMGGYPESEDCLFLDVVVPGKAIRGEVKNLPVVNWIYGGAYILGAKGVIYDGNPMVKAMDGNAVFVGANYRLGSLGFLAGPEAEAANATNAGLYDQRAAGQWITKYISLFGGDPEKVTVMGESAGGGSIVHHLTAFGGKGDGKPWFRKAIAQSPAFSVYNWDSSKTGHIEETYKLFLESAGCSGKGIECMRTVPFKTIKSAQEKAINAALAGTFGFGPTPDGKLIRQLPQLELVTGNHWKDMDSIIMTHVSDEPALFTPKNGDYTDKSFQAYLDYEYRNESAITKAVFDHYPLAKFEDGRARLMEYSMHSTFVCSVRFVAERFPGKTYVGVFEGLHGSDVIADFYDASSPLGKAGSLIGGSKNEDYQSYLMSYILTGDPNKKRFTEIPDWPIVTDTGNELGGVLFAGKNFKLINDAQTDKDSCHNLINVWGASTALVGIVPPGAQVKSPLAAVPEEQASANFRKA